MNRLEPLTYENLSQRKLIVQYSHKSRALGKFHSQSGRLSRDYNRREGSRTRIPLAKQLTLPASERRWRNLMLRTKLLNTLPFSISLLGTDRRSLVHHRVLTAKWEQ